MSTIAQHISNLRGLLVKYSRTQDNWTDQYLYEQLNGARTRVIKQGINKLNHVSEWMWQTYTIELEESDPANWECVPTYLKGKCKVVKSKYKIPRPIKGNNKSFVGFKTLGGKDIDLYSEDEQTIFKDDKIRSRTIMASIINGYLYIWNSPDIRFIKAIGIWQNPLDWAKIPDCSGELDACFDANTSEYPLDEDDKQVIYQLTLELLGVTLKIIPDQTNNGNEFGKG